MRDLSRSQLWGNARGLNQLNHNTGVPKGSLQVMKHPYSGITQLKSEWDHSKVKTQSVNPSLKTHQQKARHKKTNTATDWEIRIWFIWLWAIYLSLEVRFNTVYSATVCKCHKRMLCLQKPHTQWNKLFHYEVFVRGRSMQGKECCTID